ncbi:MAG: hypothetical protein AB2A00_42430 [Myxococcota bacterium]
MRLLLPLALLLLSGADVLAQEPDSVPPVEPASPEAPPPATAEPPPPEERAPPEQTAPPAEPARRPTTEPERCREDDVECLRRRYFRAAGRTAPPGAVAGECSDAPGSPIRCTPAPTDEGFGLPWLAVAPLQWGSTLIADTLPAVVFAVTAVVALLPASTVPTIALACLGIGLIPCLPCVEGLATNLLGDVLTRGTLRGRLALQVLVGWALVGVQLATAGVVGLITALIMNQLAVATVTPAVSRLLVTCEDPATRLAACGQQAWNVSQAAGALATVGAAGMLAMVALNLVVAALVKGPLLALTWYLGSAQPHDEPYPRFLPRLARGEPAAMPRPDVDEVTTVARAAP